MRCTKIKDDGKKCNSTALEREDLCVYHSFSEQAKKLKEEGKRAGKGTTTIGIGRR